MKITKTRLKEIIKEEVQNTITEKSPAQKDLEQASRAIVSGLAPEEQSFIARLTTMLVKYAKKRNLTQGEVARLLNLVTSELAKQMKLPATPPEKELDEMAAMSTGAIVTSPKKEPLEENGWDEPVS
mgnify:CR=1 FL=1